eukprot:scaffold388_cov244-Pinguiococcus_pyrenoidosus.AAC.8
MPGFAWGTIGTESTGTGSEIAARREALLTRRPGVPHQRGQQSAGDGACHPQHHASLYGVADALLLRKIRKLRHAAFGASGRWTGLVCVSKLIHHQLIKETAGLMPSRKRKADAVNPTEADRMLESDASIARRRVQKDHAGTFTNGEDLLPRLHSRKSEGPEPGEP